MMTTIYEVVERANRELIGVPFDEAMKKTQFGRFQYGLILIAGIFMGSAFYETMGINYVLPVAECDLGITHKTQYGLISGIWFAGIILASHSWGFLSDAYGRRKTLIVASLSAFCASALSSLAGSLWQMMLFRFLNGLCMSGSTSIIFAYLGEFLTDKNRSRSMMAASVLFGAWCLSLPVLAWLIINQDWALALPLLGVVYRPWRFFLMACGFPSLVCGLALLFFPESPKFTFSQGDEAKTLRILERIYRANTGRRDFDVVKLKPNEEFNEAAVRHSRKANVFAMMFRQTATLCRSHPRSIAILSVLQFGIYFNCNGMLLFFPDILNQTARFVQQVGAQNASDTHLCTVVESAIREQQMTQAVPVCIDELDISSYYYAMLLESCYVIGFLLISWLVNYTGRLAIFAFFFFTTSACAFAINYSGTRVGTYLYIWLLASGINNTLMNTVTYDLFPTNLRSLAMSLSLMFGRLGSLVGGNVAGFLLEKYCNATFTLSAAVLFVSGVLTFLIPGITKRK